MIASREISLGSEVCLPDSATNVAGDLAKDYCVDVFISMRTASAAAQTPADCSKLHQQPIDAVFRPTFVHKLCDKLPSVVSFTLLQTFD